MAIGTQHIIRVTRNQVPPLPVDALLPSILASLQHTPRLVIEAAPGAGKTTRVPSALLNLVRGEVVVLEPRRIAARLAARRVAWERSEEVGDTVGYQVRFEDISSSRTRLRFVTEGILTRRMLSDPTLKNIDAIVLDEFHERHLDSDLALALLKRLQRSRPDLLIVVMSATLDGARIAAYLDECPVLRSEGRLYPLSIHHLPYSADSLQVQVRHAVERLLSEGHTGHTLVFLPGAAEIRRALRECEPLVQRNGWLALPLHGDLSPTEQDRAIQPSSQPKLILSTNVAESSVTIEGVTAVIDTGLARFASWSPWTGLPSLQVGRVSQASAQQRAGRAGRTAPGRVLRLFAEEDFRQRPKHEAPEIVRSELSQLALALRILHIDWQTLEWLDAPPSAAIAQADALLNRLGANGAVANQLARYPLPPRLARILVEAAARGVAEQACLAVSLLGSNARGDQSDLLARMDAPVDDRTAQQLQQLRRLAHLPSRPASRPTGSDDALLLSILSGFPDRVARRRAGSQVLLANSVAAEIEGTTTTYEFMVALDAEDRSEKPLPLIRLTSRIEPEWLIDMFPDYVREQTELTWNRTGERVEEVSALLYDDLVIQESRGAATNADAAADLLAQKALEAGLDRFVDADVLRQFLARVQLAGLPHPDLARTTRELCTGLKTFAELRAQAKHFLSLLEQKVDARQLQHYAPLSVRLHGGRQLKIHYDEGRPPWIASRLQDFFGMQDTPRIGPEQTPLVIHLLAPNQRAVQTTTDLAGFWLRLYPQVRKELMRRYPRHSWPERPS